MASWLSTNVVKKMCVRTLMDLISAFVVITNIRSEKMSSSVEVNFSNSFCGLVFLTIDVYA